MNGYRYSVVYVASAEPFNHYPVALFVDREEAHRYADSADGDKLDVCTPEEELE